VKLLIIQMSLNSSSLYVYIVFRHSVDAAETDVSVEDATDEKSQRQPRKRKRNSSGSEDMEGAQYRGGDTQGSYVRTSFRFIIQIH